MKTLKELADLLQVDKKKVEYQASKIDSYLVPKKNGVRYLTELAESIIIKELTPDSLPNSGSESGANYQLEILEKELQHKSDQLKEKDKQLDSKDKQLESKDKQLESKDKQLEQLHKLLDQQQQLQLATNRQIESNQPNQPKEILRKKWWQIW